MRDSDLVLRRHPDVVGLEVAVHDARLVRRLQRAADLPEQPPHLAERHRPALEARRQALAVEVLHHEVVAPVGELIEGEDVDDVRVADLVDRARLLLEAADQIGVTAPRAAPAP